MWAPAAQSVRLHLRGVNRPMRRLASGWWEPEGRVPRTGDYGFLIDGEGPFPDPRSAWQPTGVHGLSRRFPAGRFRWGDQGWQPPPLSSGVIYELHVGTFTAEGTFAAAISKLDHLVELGITHVELMPVHQFPGARGWGYDAATLFATHSAYGGPSGLMRFVDACHARSLAVILDVVYNHLSPEGNYLPVFGPYLTDRYGTNWGQAVNLDGPGSDQVRRLICDNALGWLRDFHLDGLRLDAVHGFIEISALPLLEQLATEVGLLQGELGRQLTVIAENNQNDSRIIRPRNSGGMGLGLMWNDDFHHALHVALTGNQDGYYRDFNGVEDLRVCLEQGLVYSGRYARSREAVIGRPRDYPPYCQLVAYLQNHDQVGNRALGDRIGHLVEAELAAIGAVLLLTSPFVPMLFQGEEWGAATPFLYFTDLQDPRLGRAVRLGRRREFSEFLGAGTVVPDPQAEATFERSKLNWEELADPSHREVLSLYRNLIALRHQQRDLWASAERPEVSSGSGWMLVRRGGVLVAANLSRRRRVFSLGGRFGKPDRVLLESSPGARLGIRTVSVPAKGFAVLSCG
ncbi:MAG: malto-oligosyltrehalose trehalohydrolase [Candidatus Dormibacteria bacterium]